MRSLSRVFAAGPFFLGVVLLSSRCTSASCLTSSTFVLISSLILPHGLHRLVGELAKAVTGSSHCKAPGLFQSFNNKVCDGGNDVTIIRVFRSEGCQHKLSAVR